MLIIRDDYVSPEDNLIEITERKGIGHRVLVCNPFFSG